MEKRISRTIGKGQRDIELLGALTSNDSSRFNRVISRLEGEARQRANELLDGENIEEAVSKAIDKVIDWMRSDAVFKVNHPFAYAKRLIYNAVIDYARTNKERAIPEDQIKEDLAWLDEEMGYFGEDEEGNEQARAGSWHGVEVGRNVLGQDFLKLATMHYPEHRWLRALRPLNLARCADWFFAGMSKKDCNKRWSQYKLIMALIENIPSLREQQIIKHFLWGYRTTDIAKELDVSKAYVSKVVTNWLKGWGWDKIQRDKIRFILLTHYLANAYAGVMKEIYRKEQQLYPPPPEDLSPEEEIAFFRAQAERKCIDRWPLIKDRDAADMLYRNIIKATETKAHFSDLQESDNLALLEVCSTCHTYWYSRGYAG